MSGFNMNGCQRAAHKALVGGVRAEVAPSGLAQILEMQNQLGQTFEEFKAKNDERLKEIEKKGSADALLSEQVGTMQAFMAESSKKIDDFIRKQERMSNEIDARLGRSQLGPLAPVNYDKEAEIFNSVLLNEGIKANFTGQDMAEYAKGIGNYIRKGRDRLSHEVQNAMSVGSDVDGGYFVDPARSATMIKRLFDTSPVRQYANIVTISSDKYEIPLDVNDATSGGWVGEKTAPSETATPRVGMHVIEAHEQFAEPRITQKLIEDSAFDVETWLYNKIVEKMTRVENTAFVNGDGASKPRGIMAFTGSAVVTADATRAWEKIQYLPTLTSGAFGANGVDQMIKLMTHMKPSLRKGAVWFSNRLTLGTVMTLKDGEGRYIWTMGNIQAGQPSTLQGHPMGEFEDMADIAANTFSMAFANLREGYTIVDRLSFTLLRDIYTAKPYVKYYTRKRTGGDVTNFDAIKYLKFGTS